MFIRQGALDSPSAVVELVVSKVVITVRFASVPLMFIIMMTG